MLCVYPWWLKHQILFKQWTPTIYHFTSNGLDVLWHWKSPSPKLHFHHVCRLFGHGIGIHLLQSENPESLPKKTVINPKDNHLSFQCESVANVEKLLTDMEIEYVRALVEEGGILVEQLFFHDPDGFMIEICDCDNLPVIPLAGEVARSCGLVNNMQQQMVQQQLRAN